MALFKKKKTEPIPYDRADWQPAVRTSICTGEMTLGFIHRQSGRFREYGLARSRAEVEDFCRGVDIAPEELKEIY